MGGAGNSRTSSNPAGHLQPRDDAHFATGEGIASSGQTSSSHGASCESGERARAEAQQLAVEAGADYFYAAHAVAHLNYCAACGERSQEMIFDA